MLPRLTLHTLSLNRLSDEGDYRLRLVVENSGFLPTYTSAQGRKRVAARPVRAELELPNGVILSSGQPKTEMGHLEGRSGKLSVSTIFTASPTDNRAWAEWILRGRSDAEVKVRSRSARAGSLEDSVSCVRVPTTGAERATALPDKARRSVIDLEHIKKVSVKEQTEGFTFWTRPSC